VDVGDECNSHDQFTAAKEKEAWLVGRPYVRNRGVHRMRALLPGDFLT
jgi:hypothetical protein